MRAMPSSKFTWPLNPTKHTSRRMLSDVLLFAISFLGVGLFISGAVVLRGTFLTSSKKLHCMHFVVEVNETMFHKVCICCNPMFVLLLFPGPCNVGVIDFVGAFLVADGPRLVKMLSKGRVLCTSVAKMCSARGKPVQWVLVAIEDASSFESVEQVEMAMAWYGTEPLFCFFVRCLSAATPFRFYFYVFATNPFWFSA